MDGYWKEISTLALSYCCYCWHLYQCAIMANGKGDGQAQRLRRASDILGVLSDNINIWTENHLVIPFCVAFLHQQMIWN